MKVHECPRCNTTHPYEEFVTKTDRQQFKTYCRRCCSELAQAYRRRRLKKDPERERRKERDYNLRRMYGITLEEYESMAHEQGGICLICKTTGDGKGRGALHTDHCHATGVVRGLLCHHCNIGLGNFMHDTERLRAAIEYLEDAAARKAV